MKHHLQFLLQIAVFVFIAPPLLASAHGENDYEKKQDTVSQIDGFQKLYQYKNYYLSAQPNIELLEYAKHNGVDLVINLRSESEMQKYRESSYDEEKLVRGMGIEYKQIPIEGMKSYTPETLSQFAKAIESTKGRVLIHCAGCGRVTHVFMAYLIKHQSYTIEKAVEIGKQLTFAIPVEKLLGEELTLHQN